MKLVPTGVLKALATEFKMLFGRRNITVQYPRQRYEIPERGRYGVEMIINEQGEHLCTGCKLCQQACPYHVIDIEVSAREGGRHIDHWHYVQSACVMCGYCVEACTFNAIVMGPNYERAHVDPALKSIELLTDTPVARPKRPERPAAAAAPAASADVAGASNAAPVEAAAAPTEGSADELA